MKKMFRNRKGLSTVVTTLIILVVSVLLATVVTYYAINVTSTRVVEESIDIRRAHVWYNSTYGAQAAFIIINTGGRDVVIDKITVRGQECTWSTQVFYYSTSSDVSGDPQFKSSSTLSDGVQVTVGSNQYTLSAASDDLTLKSGYTMIVYIDDPDSISVNDVGTTVSIVVYTAQAQYYEECNVEGIP